MTQPFPKKVLGTGWQEVSTFISQPPKHETFFCPRGVKEKVCISLDLDKKS